MLLRKKTPIVFIHGILGSMGEGILKGTGELHFGVAEIVYRPIINTLKSFGYREDKDLFICYYDWTKGNMESAKKYLIPVIEKAKQKSKSRSVDIVCHSMGGIVARAYAQSEFYKNDINKLIMIGTPNSGSANAYFFWSGGDMISKEPYKNVLYRLVKSGFIWYVRFKYNKDIDMEFIREKIPSVEELLPSYEYGDYLINQDERQTIHIEDMTIKNEFLNKLNSNKDILRKRKIKTYMIMGKDIDTIDKIKVINADDKIEKWRDGKPVGIVKTYMGDGTVTCNSIKTIQGKTIYIDSDHTDILSDCKSELASILNIRKGIFTKQENEKNIIYSVIGKDVEFEVGGNKRYKYKTCNIVSKKISEDIQWAVITTNENSLDINIESTKDKGKIVVNKVDISTGEIKENIIDTSNEKCLKI